MMNRLLSGTNYFSKKSNRHMIIQSIHHFRKGHYNEANIGKWLLAVGLVGGAGSTLAYNYSPEFRTFADKQLADKWSQLDSTFFGKKSAKSESSVSKQSKHEEVKPVVEDTPLKATAKTVKTETKSVDINKSDSKQNSHDKVTKAVIDNEAIERSLINQLRQTEMTADRVISAAQNLQDLTEKHVEAYKQALDNEDGDRNQLWQQVTESKQLRDDAEINFDNSKKTVDENMDHLLQMYVDAAKIKELKSKSSVAEVHKSYSRLKRQLNDSYNNLSTSCKKIESLSDYKNRVAKILSQSRKEMKSLPYNKDDKKSVEQSSVLYLQNKLEQHQKELALLQSTMSIQIEEAKQLQREQDNILEDQHIAQELAFQNKANEEARQARDLALKREMEEDLKQSLARQAAAHSQHITNVLRIQKDELEKQSELDLRDGIVKERENFHRSLQDWIDRIEAIETAVEARALNEVIIQEAQDMWVACRSFNNALSVPDKSVGLQRHLKYIQSSLRPMTLTKLEHVLDNVDPEMRNQGIWSSAGLMKRFKKVKKLCCRTDLIDETGGSLFQFALSYIQSLFIIERNKILETEADILAETERPDTFLLMTSAERAIYREDWAFAIKLLNMLHGMPRSIANDWICDARKMVEANTIARTLSCYATAMSTGTQLPPVYTSQNEPKC